MKNTFLTDQDRKEIEAKIPSSPIVSLTTTTEGVRISVSDASGTQSQVVRHGVDGVGIADIHLTSTTGKVDTYSIVLTDETRLTFTVTNGSNGKTPVVGVDYFTEADKASFLEDVIAALPIYNGEAEGV